MTDIHMRTYAFKHAREIEGQYAPIDRIMATAEVIYRFLAESRRGSASTTRH